MSDADPTTRELAIEIEHGKEVVNLRVNALTARLDASDKAIRVYETSMQEWKASHNEWRKSLEDSRKDTLSRSEVNARFEIIMARVDSQEKSINENRGRATGYNASWGILIAILSLLFAAWLVVVEMKK